MICVSLLICRLYSHQYEPKEVKRQNTIQICISMNSFILSEVLFHWLLLYFCEAVCFSNYHVDQAIIEKVIKQSKEFLHIIKMHSYTRGRKCGDKSLAAGFHLRKQAFLSNCTSLSSFSSCANKHKNNNSNHIMLILHISINLLLQYKIFLVNFSLFLNLHQTQLI